MQNDCKAELQILPKMSDFMELMTMKLVNWLHLMRIP